jgi:hypothetical protein
LESNEQDVDLSSDLDSAGINDDNIKLGQTDDASAYEFLLGYVVELVLALIVYYPLLGTILFSGVLVCGKIPVLGGRPYEVLVQKRLEGLDKTTESLPDLPPELLHTEADSPRPSSTIV